MNDTDIINEINQIISEKYLTDVLAVYGFGSYFRSTSYSDIDLIVVSTDKTKDELSVYQQLLDDLGGIAKKYSVLLDLTYLKYSEFSDAPILEKDSLVEIYGNGI